ncbi:MAG: biopolymer transporter ExbD [Prosthecobacter sp.]|jgi:biopolymer transport protein ExbD|uniref:ExbD/TolR family protein n=1 Tax=Prosthecobacter sp. TaxID=1965333 RepID=UPI0019DA22EB|nr:biopolymer transporter ExbD [Prosthecobacter sp.]MBE2287022.1 biopolymer transporter ExbD [Prosthecobacter sp.]
MKLKHVIRQPTDMPGFQIAPMIDVVFVIMLFFMVMVGSVKVERDIGLRLPGPPLEGHVTFPDNEVTIGVLEDGTVTMNDEAFDSPEDKALPSLTHNLRRLAESSARQKQNVLVTVQAEQLASYERVMDVLNSLHKARLTNVTFTIAASSF